MAGDNTGNLFIKTFTNNTDWGNNFISETTSTPAFTSATTADIWESHTVCATIEANATFAQAGLYFKQFGSTAGTMFFDDFSLVEVSSCP